MKSLTALRVKVLPMSMAKIKSKFELILLTCITMSDLSLSVAETIVHHIPAQWRKWPITCRLIFWNQLIYWKWHSGFSPPCCNLKEIISTVTIIQFTWLNIWSEFLSSFSLENFHVKLCLVSKQDILNLSCFFFFFVFFSFLDRLKARRTLSFFVTFVCSAFTSVATKQCIHL